MGNIITDIIFCKKCGHQFEVTIPEGCTVEDGKVLDCAEKIHAEFACLECSSKYVDSIDL